MANTYTQLYIHLIFAVKYRNSVLQKEWRNKLFSVIGNLINKTHSKNYIVNGVEDHVHCLISYKPQESLSDVIKHVKTNSSKWLNQSNYLNSRFEWQRGYGAFTYSSSHLNKVFNYIKNQEKHHTKKPFRQEYIELLKKFEVDYDDAYIFEELKQL